MNLYEESTSTSGSSMVVSGGDIYSASIYNNINNNANLSNNLRDVTNLSRANKRRIVI